MATRRDALAARREALGYTQETLAHKLGVEFSTIGRWERGSLTPQPWRRAALAKALDVSLEELDVLLNPRVNQPRPIAPSTNELDAAVHVEAARLSRSAVRPPVGAADDREDFHVLETDAEVSQDQKRWLATRAALGSTRRALAVVAEELYPDSRVPGLEGTGVIAHPDWIPKSPIPLHQVSLVLDPAAGDPVVTGGEPQTAAVRPLATTGQRYRRYHDAIRELAPPRLFENRLCFRLTRLDCCTTTMAMQFGHMGFFDSMDVNEALAHETALHHLAYDHHDQPVTLKPSWQRLTFRKLVGDPFDLTRRPLMGAVGTLTVRGGRSPSIVLHQRDGRRVAGGGGMTHLLPAAIFQPSSVLPAAIAEDFSLWRNIQREFAEELLGHDEYDGSGRPIAYGDLEPFVTLDRAREAGDIMIWCLGITLDALTLSGDILTVAVIAPDLYDDLFAGAVRANSEGSVPARALPFDEHTLCELREHGQLSPGAAAALHLAWTHRDQLLSR
ncbi:helix-turn-helix domain-containing protein [Gandjariella thermophila]|uniref:HTH cro/C1-type domain-containing protein n=1 Tax=Gandjariella thermophila TaxID=1931992 RepID=A0A4D4JHV8_9PSEU|nr:helix-turn-helix transcriptional regulator [Gandjariella thermophila]GDY33467.1 hypothetical protein GTS_51000 [Gandjariella thermophila]